VTIGSVEKYITDTAWAEGWVDPLRPGKPTGQSIGIIGAGPAGSTAAEYLRAMGHDVHVYDRHDRAGGLLTYGIPGFKLEKDVVMRRIDRLRDGGIHFHLGFEVGKDATLDQLRQKHDAILVATGVYKAREINVPGNDAAGVVAALDYLIASNRKSFGDTVVEFEDGRLDAHGKHVVVVGGGDTASDCVGTAFRQGAVKVTQLDIRPQPPKTENKLEVWPYWATKMRVSSSQAEGAVREFQVATLEFVGEDGQLTGVKCAQVDDRRKPIPGTEFVIKADLAFIAIGFRGPFTDSVLKDMGSRLTINTDRRGSTNVVANERDYKTSVDKLFAAGDVRRGQSLVVWAINEGRGAARECDRYLMGSTDLP